MSKLVRPGATAGMRHVALFVENLEATRHFYTEMLGMQVEWQPDEDNVYLTSGNDNLALHRYTGQVQEADRQRLDHIGFIIDSMDDVDKWHEYFVANGVNIVAKPKTHRDGARSFYCTDPSGTVVQLIYHPPISASWQKSRSGVFN